MGNFNCDLMKSPVDNHTKHLITLCETHHLTQHIDKPPWITPNSRTLLNQVLSSTPEKITSHGVIRCAIADHDLVFCMRACKPPKGNLTHRNIETRCFKHFNEEDFITDLKLCLWNSIEIYDDIDDSLAHWKELFMEVCNRHCPVVCRRVRTYFLPSVDIEIREQIKLKHYYQREPHNKNLPILWMMYKHFRNNVSNMLIAAKKKYSLI